jgi:hypothetical protein
MIIAPKIRRNAEAVMVSSPMSWLISVPIADYLRRL